MSFKYVGLALLGYSTVSIIMYYIFIVKCVQKKKLKIFFTMLAVILSLINVGGLITYYTNGDDMTLENIEDTNEGIQVNEKSQYVNEYLMYVSFRDMEVTSLGSEEAYLDEIKNEGMTEMEYAKSILTEILEEQHVKNAEEVATKAIDENWHYAQ